MAKGEFRDTLPPVDKKLDDPPKKPFPFGFHYVICLVVFALCGLVALSLYGDDLEKHFTKIKTVEKIKYVEHIKMPTHLFIEHLKPSLDPDVAKQIARAVDEYSKQYQLPKKLILSIIFKESSFNIFAKSPSNAIGLMQVIPKYHKDKIDKLGIKDQRKLYHISNNINLGCMVWKTYYDQSKKDLDETFHRYLSKNASEDTKNKYKTAILETWARLEFLEFKYENGKEKEHASANKIPNGSKS